MDCFSGGAVHSCTYRVPGCTDPSAVNFDSLANLDSGDCLVCAVVSRSQWPM